MEIQLYLKENSLFKALKVPLYVAKNLLRDQLAQSEVSRIHRLAHEITLPKKFEINTLLVDFSTKTAESYQTGINYADLEPTWKIIEK